VQAICERVIVINKGVIVADDTPDNLSHTLSTDHKLIVRIAGPEQDIYQLLQKLPNMLQVDKLGQRGDGSCEFSLESQSGTDIRRDMFFRLAERNWPIMALRSSELSLEDIFLQLVDDASPKKSEVKTDAGYSSP
jgi:ABC-2 type transport system ATP-binding protein